MRARLRLLSLQGRTWILAGGFLLALLSGAGAILATWSSRSVALREWEARLQSVAHMLAAHAGQSIGAADLVLRSLSDNVNEYRISDDREMRWVFSSRHTYDMLREAAKALPQIDVVTVAAKDGTVLNFTREFPPPPINLLDRDYFQAHLADPDLDVYLSKPVQNRGNGTWTFYLARKIRSPSGDMIGLVLTGLHSRYFADFYGSTGLDLQRISLLRYDGSLLSRHAAGYAAPDGPPEPAQMLERLESAPSGALFTPDEGRFSELAAFARSTNLPVAVSVAATRAQFLREWERESMKFAVEGGAIVAILIVATLMLWRLVGQLEAARNQALSAVEAKTRFASNVSHELRTPMNVIIGGSHQLMQTDLSPDSQRYAALVASSAQQIMVLINDVLDYSYYEARNFRIEPAPYDPRALAEEAVAMARTLAPESQVTFQAEATDRVPALVLGDAARIKQVVLNLISNAVKYTERGSVRLRLDYEIGASALDIVVSDTGRGIPKDELARIFEPFERGRSAQARPGTGLGLTICKKLVEAMRGAIDVTSRPGAGSTFSVRLPAPPVVGDGAQASTSKPHARPLDILIAEDVAPSRLLLTAMLEKLGHCVVAVENGRDAVEAMRERSFDLVLMDLQMPELDGLAATALIRAMPGPKSRVPVIAVSANADLGSETGLRAAGFDDIVLKPVTPARLQFVLAEAAAA